jgi:hypothetical protein
MQKKQDKLIHKIDEQNILMEKEKTINQKLIRVEKSRDDIVEQIAIIIMKIGRQLIMDKENMDPALVKELSESCYHLEERYKELTESINHITLEYETLMNISDEIQKDFDMIRLKEKSKK